MGKANKKLLAALTQRATNDPKKLFQGIPKPGKTDGKCDCGCCHKPDHGACPKFYQGSNRRCAICDHGILCHRRKGEPPPADWNSPTALPGPLMRFIPPSAKSCPECAVFLIQCPACKSFIPIKSLDSGYHIGHCPKDGYFDLPCKIKP